MDRPRMKSQSFRHFSLQQSNFIWQSQLVCGFTGKKHEAEAVYQMGVDARIWGGEIKVEQIRHVLRILHTAHTQDNVKEEPADQDEKYVNVKQEMEYDAANLPSSSNGRR